MAKELRIVFMGTPDFAVGVLKKIVESGRKIVGVITAPDRPAGRGRKLMASSVKEYALSQGLKVLQPTNLKSEKFLNDLKALDANLQVVVAFRMLPKVVWQMPEFGTFNLHASLLPNYRGAAPINWAIINKEEKTGVTTFFIDEKIDTGAVIAKTEVEIRADEDAGSLHDKLMEHGADLVLETLELIENGEANTIAQPQNGDLREAPKLTSENTRIDWHLPGKDIAAFIRGLSPYPVAWTSLWDHGEEIKLKVYKAHFEKTVCEGAIGSITTSKKEMKVCCLDGVLFLEEIQLPGKRRMEISALLNGHSFGADAHVR